MDVPYIAKILLLEADIFYWSSILLLFRYEIGFLNCIEPAIN